MKWEKRIDVFGRETGDWLAKGKTGHFLLWKEKGLWRILYMDDVKHKVVFRLCASDLKSAKQKCEENYYWEDEDGGESGSKGSA